MAGSRVYPPNLATASEGGISIVAVLLSPKELAEVRFLHPVLVKKVSGTFFRVPDTFSLWVYNLIIWDEHRELMLGTKYTTF